MKSRKKKKKIKDKTNLNIVIKLARNNIPILTGLMRRINLDNYLSSIDLKKYNPLHISILSILTITQDQQPMVLRTGIPRVPGSSDPF